MAQQEAGIINYRLNIIYEKLARQLAKLLPKRVVYYCLIRAWNYSSTGEYETDASHKLTISTIIHRWQDASLTPNKNDDTIKQR